MAEVLVVGNGPPARGGIPSVIAALAGSELATRHDLRFLNLSPTDPGGRVRRLSTANVQRTLSDVRRLWRAAPGCDVVHLHTSLGPVATTARAGALALAGRLRGARVLLHAHGGYVELAMRARWRRVTTVLLLAPVDVVVTVAETTRASLSSILQRTPVVQVDNGVDVGRFRSVVRRERVGPPRVLYAGYLTPRKGLLDLFAASTALLEDGVEHEVVVVGAAADDEAGADELIRAAAPPQVRLAGPLDVAEMPTAYADADVYCLPSWWEAMPMSVLEAMAAGLPVVATAVGDVSRLVRDGATGLVVPPRDRDALADALRSVFVDPERRRSLGRAAAEAARDRWDIAVAADALDDIIRHLLSQGRRRRRRRVT